MNRTLKALLIIELQITLALLVYLAVKTDKIERVQKASNIIIAEIFEEKQIKEVSEIKKGDVVLGNREAKINIIFYTNYNCPYCSEFISETFPQLYENIIKPGYASFTIRFLHSPKNEHFPVTQRIYNNYHNNEIDQLISILKFSHNGELVSGKDENIGPEEYKSIVRANYMLANMNGISATPTLIINGEKYLGHKRISFFMELVDELEVVCE